MSQNQVDWFDSAFSHPAFDSLKRRAAPLLILELHPVRAVWANISAAVLFGTAHLDELTRRLLGPNGASTPTIDALAHNLKPASGPRLERLRIVQGAALRNSTLLCHRLSAPAETVRIAAAIVDMDRLRSVDLDLSATWRRSAIPAENSNTAPMEPDLADAGPLLIGAADECAEVAQNRSEPPDFVETARERLRRAFGGVATWRFLWRTDALGCLLDIDSGTFERLGAAVSPAVQRPFAETIAEFAPEQAERLRNALASRRAWSRMKIVWPLSEGRIAAPVTLGGSPQYESGREFAGFRGFGIVDLANAGAMPDVLGTRQSTTRSPSFEEAAPIQPALVEVLPGSASAMAANDSEARFALIDPVSIDRVSTEAAFVDTSGETAGRDSSGNESAPSQQPANVVRLRPLQPHGPGRMADASRGGSLQADAELVSGDSRDPGADPGKDSAAIPGPEFSPDRNGSLSSSEHIAFQEIARTLGGNFLDSKRPLNETEGSETERSHREDSGHALAHEAMPSGPEAPPAVLAKSESTEHGTGPQFGEQEFEGLAGAITLRALLDAAGDAIAAVDVTGRVVALNRQAERWFGRDRRHLSGETLVAFLGPENQALATSLLAEVTARPDGLAEAKRELLVRTPQGLRLPLVLTMARIGDRLFSAVWRDLSTERRLERDLARAQLEAERTAHQRPEFLAKVNDEIRTPLNAVLGFAEIMIDERFGPLGNPRYKDCLQDIHASGTHVIGLVNDLLDLSRIESGRANIQLGSVEVNKVIGDCVTQMQPQAHRERVIVRTSFGAHLPPVLADEHSVRQIVANLLSNAVKFNEPGGQVIVSTAVSDAGTVVARIRDTGLGMSDDDITAALEPFRQLAPSRQAGGAGLGLPLTKALAGANGASMSIRSRPGEGTLVEVSFAPATTIAARVPA